MGGYSKIKDINNNDPKSPSKSATDDFPSDPNKVPEPAQEEPMKQEEEDVKGKLKRNFSTTTSSRFMRLDRQNSSSIVSSKALQGALRRAFSVRSSSSDKYSRIYSDRPVALASPFEEDVDDGEEDGDSKAGSGKKDAKEKKHKSSKIFRACKRILGL